MGAVAGAGQVEPKFFSGGARQYQRKFFDSQKAALSQHLARSRYFDIRGTLPNPKGVLHKRMDVLGVLHVVV